MSPRILIVEDEETLLELLPVGVWIGNANCEELMGNRAAYEILGLPFGINASMTSPQAAQPPLVHLRFSINGEPVPPVTAIGAAVSKKSQRLRFAQASLNASRSQLSKM